MQISILMYVNVPHNCIYKILYMEFIKSINFCAVLEVVITVVKKALKKYQVDSVR